MLVGEGLPNFRSPGFCNVDNERITSMAVYDGAVYLGTANTVDGCDVFRRDGTAFTQVVGQSPPGTPGTGPGFGSEENRGAWSMASYGPWLYVGTLNNGEGCEVWRYNGVAWTPEARAKNVNRLFRK